MKDHYDTDGDGDREELYFDASRLYGLPGWKEITCVPGQYPSFKEPACNCLGDTHIGPDKSLEVSWCAGDCRADEKTWRQFVCG